jgi:hypothetical protein
MMLAVAAAAFVVLTGLLSGADTPVDDRPDDDTLAAATLAAIGPL